MGKFKRKKELGQQSIGKRIHKGFSDMKEYEDPTTISDFPKKVELARRFQQLDDNHLNISDDLPFDDF